MSVRELSLYERKPPGGVRRPGGSPDGWAAESSAASIAPFTGLRPPKAGLSPGLLALGPWVTAVPRLCLLTTFYPSTISRSAVSPELPLDSPDTAPIALARPDIAAIMA